MRRNRDATSHSTPRPQQQQQQQQQQRPSRAHTGTDVWQRCQPASRRDLLVISRPRIQPNSRKARALPCFSRPPPWRLAWSSSAATQPSSLPALPRWTGQYFPRPEKHIMLSWLLGIGRPSLAHRSQASWRRKPRRRHGGRWSRRYGTVPPPRKFSPTHADQVLTRFPGSTRLAFFLAQSHSLPLAVRSSWTVWGTPGRASRRMGSSDISHVGN
jgi:hypothetical protein